MANHDMMEIYCLAFEKANVQEGDEGGELRQKCIIVHKTYTNGIRYTAEKNRNKKTLWCPIHTRSKAR